MTHNTAPCFCCSTKPFNSCCKPILKDHTLALTPLMLMRSRYSAYVLADEAHLLKTWATATRPESLSLKDSPVKWVGLTIHNASDTDSHSKTGQVDFSAVYIVDDQFCELREESNFIREEGLWYYVDGKTETTSKKLGRNSPCPCGSGKKFKRCCLNL